MPLLTSDDQTESPPAVWPQLRRSLPYLKSHRRSFAVLVAGALIMAGLGAVEPLLTKYIFDALGTERPLEMLGLALAGLVALEIARAVLGGWSSVLTWDVRLKIDYKLRETVYGKIYELPISYHRKQQVGGLVNKVNQSIAGFLGTAMELCTSTLPSIAFLGISIVLMIQLDWRLTVLVLTFLPLPTLIGWWAAREQAQRERKLIETWSGLYARLHETLAGILTVKGFARERFEVEQFLAGSRKGNDIVYRGVRRDALTNGARNFASTVARIAAIGVGAYLIVLDEITVGTLIAFLGYIGSLFGPVQGLTGVYQSVRRCAVSLEILFDVLDSEDEDADRTAVTDGRIIDGVVRFRDVSFSYPDGDQVLSGFSLDVWPGETIALVGPSGAGKTTLINLLQRHYHVSGGAIEIDGANIEDIELQSLRRKIGTVFQDVQLFNESVHANIAFGRPDASREEVVSAAVAASAHGFISDLPDGYDTILGEQASRLSGGQKQRIAIARTLLLDPPILVFDEATSALDAESEAAVQRALREIAKARTTFVIAHRLSTIADADRIVVIREGRIAATGRHEDLLRECPFYARLVRLQMGDDPVEEAFERHAYAA